MFHSQRVPSEVNKSMPNARNINPGLGGRLFLRDEELDAGAGLILAAEKRLSAVADEAILAAGLSRGGFDILMGVRVQPGLTGRVMRERLAMTVPTFARLLGDLSKRGLIKKSRSGKDGRAQLLYLSEAGEAMAGPIAAAMRDALREAYRAAGAEHVGGARAVLEAIISGGEHG